jgi:hypothetical protein
MTAILTLGAAAAQSVSHLAFSPEGSPWAMMILAIGIVGASARRRRVERSFV